MAEPQKTHSMMAGWRILIVGTGGQGVLTAAHLLTDFFDQRGHQVVSGQLHGMAQRGGSVQSSVMVDCGISPVIPEGGAHFLLGFEPVETTRALPFLSPASKVFMDSTPVIPYTLGQREVHGEEGVHYPDVRELASHIREVTSNVWIVGATELAEQAGSLKVLNIVMLGCLFGAGFLPYSADDFLSTVMPSAPAPLADTNRKAFWSGAELGTTVKVTEGTT
jgi:indolepyruvate ferredoxin oxidoreductase beta subunit